MSEFPTRSFAGATAVDTRERERAFIRSVYGWMFGGLMITAAAALWVVSSAAMQQLILGNRMVFIGLIIAEFAMVMFLSFRVMKLTPGVAAGLFFGYSLLNGLTLSSIFFVYQIGSVVTAFVVAAGMFGAMAVYGLVTKKDLTSWGSFFFMGLIGIVLCAVVNLFLRSDGLSFVISVVGVFVFLGLTAYDNQKLKAMSTATGPQVTNLAVIGALTLYLDFINIFLFLLRLFGGGRRS